MGPDFYRVAGRTGVETRCAWSCHGGQPDARGQRIARQRPADVSSGGRGPGSSFMRYILSIYACGGVLILPCLSKASRCRYLGCGAFSPWESCRSRARRYWVPGCSYWQTGLHLSMPCVWANQNLIRQDDQQQPGKQKSSLAAKPPQGSKSPSTLLLAALPQLRPSNRGIN